MDENIETPKTPTALANRAWGSIRAAPWRTGLLVLIISCLAGLGLAPSWMAFWHKCIIRGWQWASGIFGWVQIVCGFLAAALLAHKKLATKIRADWEDVAMKTAWLILLGSFVVSTVFVAPFLESSDADGRVKTLEGQAADFKAKQEVPLPAVPDVIFTTPRKIPSGNPDTLFAYEIVVQSQTPIAPFGFGFVCDGKISGHLNMPGLALTGYQIDDEKEGNCYWVKMDTGIDPKNPWSFTLYGKQDFKILRAVRIDKFR